MRSEQENSMMVISCSCPSIKIAKNIASTLVIKKLAACVQISTPITSIYQWQNELCEQQEFLLQIKCTNQCYQSIETLISQIHPYDVPEIIATPIINGLSSYVNWIKEHSKL